MKKYFVLSFMILLFSTLFSWEQENKIPSPLKVLYPFSIEVNFDKSFNLIKAEIPSVPNLIKQDEEKWSVTLTDSLVLTMMALQTGQVEVPPIQIITYDELGADTIYTQAFEVTVTAVTDSTSQLMDIKSISGAKAPILLESEFRWIYKLLKYLVLVLVMLIVFWLIYKYFEVIKSLFIKSKLSEASINKLPWEFALDEMKLIKKNMLIISGKEYLFSIEISLLIRRFLEKYYKFPAAERTTYELKEEFAKQNIANSDKIISILKRLDEVKYTKGKIVTDFSSEDIFSWFEELVLNIKEYEENLVREGEGK